MSAQQQIREVDANLEEGGKGAEVSFRVLSKISVEPEIKLISFGCDKIRRMRDNCNLLAKKFFFKIPGCKIK